MIKKTLILFFLYFVALPMFSQETPKSSYLRIPVIDLDDETFRQVVVDKEPGQYLGHPSTVLLEDKKTILAVYPKGHGKGELILKKSINGGLTWSDRLPTPESWKTSKETPTIYRVVDQKGKKRLILFSGLFPARMSISEDNGNTWSELQKVGDWGGVVVMSSLIPLNTGKGHYMALFHDDLRFIREDSHSEHYREKRGNKLAPFTLYKSLSFDGGLTWSNPEQIYSSNKMSLCEPGAIRSPDGTQIAILLRENSRQFNSQIMFSSDEGITWSEPRALQNELTGDRHVIKYAPDGRLLVVFRDITPLSMRKDIERIAYGTGESYSAIARSEGCGSPTEGDWVGWVGTWNDLVEGGPGQYRIRFKNNKKRWDCGYPGVELLKNKTFVVTSYGRWEKDEEHYVISVRFKLKELDAKLKMNAIMDLSPESIAKPEV